MLRKRIYIEYLTPGALFPEEYVEKVKKIDPKKHAKEAKKNVYAFSYYFGNRKVGLGRLCLTLQRKKKEMPTYHINAVILNKDNCHEYYKKGSAEYEDKLHKLTVWYPEGVILERLGNWQPIRKPGKDILLQV